MCVERAETNSDLEAGQNCDAPTKVMNTRGRKRYITVCVSIYRGIGDRRRKGHEFGLKT